jgi:hypothetical protein
VDPALRDLLSATVQIAPHAGLDEYGRRSYGADVAYKARVVRKHRRVLTTEGQEVISAGHAYLDGGAGLDSRVRLTLPDGSRPTVIAVEQFPDESGAIDAVVYFGPA